jgi:glyoxylase-like metal-dependent hydrolase (beta-lactamase superfamily II)
MMNLGRTTLTFGTLAATVALTISVGAQQQIRTPKQMPFPQKPDWAKLEIDTLHVQGQVSLIAGAGGNIAVQTGDEGVLLVDTGYEQMSAKALAAIRKLSNKSISRIINTT